MVWPKSWIIWLEEIFLETKQNMNLLLVLTELHTKTGTKTSSKSCKGTAKETISQLLHIYNTLNHWFTVKCKTEYKLFLIDITLNIQLDYVFKRLYAMPFQITQVIWYWPLKNIKGHLRSWRSSFLFLMLHWVYVCWTK